MMTQDMKKADSLDVRGGVIGRNGMAVGLTQ